jgi:hypothetical protein
LICEKIAGRHQQKDVYNVITPLMCIAHSYSKISSGTHALCLFFFFFFLNRFVVQVKCNFISSCKEFFEKPKEERHNKRWLVLQMRYLLFSLENIQMQKE